MFDWKYNERTVGLSIIVIALDYSTCESENIFMFVLSKSQRRSGEKKKQLGNIILGFNAFLEKHVKSSLCNIFFETFCYDR